ncbi:MAG: sigma 54-interacting transcriptional regulator [candidate division Zixibacteria bacterium]|nr:sigma 54-interacting transcriptional regulator [candidate division Zixibacteria bacterium]
MQKEISKIIFDSIKDGVFTVDKNCVIMSFNPSAERITGFTAREAIGKHCFDVFRTEICHKQCALKDTLKTKDPVEDAQVTIITRDGHEVAIQVTTTLLRNEKGEIIGAVEFFRDMSEVEHLRKSLNQKNNLKSIVSVTPKMQQLISLLPDVAESECNVLIQGPSGSGKELVAQVIHNLSPRRYGPYIKINCAALPVQLLESELFGYEKGAFTDAKRNKPGQFGLANNGTLLLDEISEMDVALQVKLLRVLNNGEYRPLGSTKTLHTNARILAATNANLQEAISYKRFREDLYYRINVVTLEIPSLRERPADIPLLVDHFLKIFKKKSRKPIESISPESLVVLRKYPFTGNVRELENAIEHAFVMCHGTVIQVEHLPPHITSYAIGTNGISVEKKNEKEIILDALRRHNGNRTRAAAELGVHRATLWRKIKSYRLSI